MATHRIEFVGGPLDGHLHRFLHSPEELPLIAKLLVNANVVRALIGQGAQKMDGQASSLAIYSLEREEASLRYRHLCSIATQEHQLDDV